MPEDPTRPHAGETQEIKDELRRRMHQPIPEQGDWLRQVVEGFLRLPRSADELTGTHGLPPPHPGTLETYAVGDAAREAP